MDQIDTERLQNNPLRARVEYYDTVDSTNDAALAAGRSGTVPPLLVVAGMQSAGRGRGSNRWWTGQRSLAFSLLLDDPFAAAVGRGSLVSLAAGLAVVQAVATQLPGQRVGIHWPNDVFVAGRKLAGILVEGLPDGRRIVVGIGLNVNDPLAAAPEPLRDTLTTLCELSGREHDRTQLLLDILDALASLVRECAGRPEEIPGRANQCCLQRGQSLTVSYDSERISGRCEGIDRDGALLLDTPAGLRRIYSGTPRPTA